MPARIFAPSPPPGPSSPRPPSAGPPHLGIAAFLRRPASFRARAALVTVNLAAATFFLLTYTRHGVGFGPYHIDLDVYRIGARVWLRGGNLYGRLPPTLAGVRLPFTYPPVAAVLLAPFAVVPLPVAATALTLATIGLLAVVLRVFLSRLAGSAAESRWVIGWLLPAALFLDPVRDTLGFGQVNVVLMALVSLDCLAAAPRWPRGALTGLAAAVKLTPAAFVLFFLLRRDYRAAARAGLSFATATAAGFAAAPRDSVRYWTHTVSQTGRAGNPVSASNQCIQAVLGRAGLGPHSPAGMAAWLALSAVVVIVASRGMRHALAVCEDCLALSLNAFAGLLISPISWSHHWVWCVPALLTLAALGSRHRSLLPSAAAATGLVIYAVAPQFWFPHGWQRELRWAAWQQATGSCYVLFAALILLLAPGMLTRRALTATGLDDHQPSRRAGARLGVGACAGVARWAPARAAGASIVVPTLGATSPSPGLVPPQM